MTEIKLISDGGSENTAHLVSKTLPKVKPRIIHKIAQVEIRHSNSMAERIFYSLKNRYLYDQELTSLKVVRRHVGFYIGEHNGVVPMPVLSGLTPNEAYRGTIKPEVMWEELKERAKRGRELRLEQNRTNACSSCKDPPRKEMELAKQHEISCNKT